MAKYEKYAEYKDSDVEWLGEIPKKWSISSIKYLSNLISTGGTPKNQISFTDEHEISWFTPSDFSGEFEIIVSSKYVTFDSVRCGESKLYPSNAILMIGIGATLGKIAICKTDFSCNQQINIIVPNKSVTLEFLAYSLMVQLEQIKQFSNSSTIGIINQEKTKQLVISFPDLIEQSQITNFLDHETAKIDTLIAKQEKLIELLKEKRQAVISHAVTKGLNPDVSLKDSGVEWLGQVPEHWDVRQLRFLGTCQNGINIGAEYFGSGSPFISYGDVYRNPQLPKVFEGLVQSTENDRKLYSIKRGDVLFTRTSETIEEIGFSSASLVDVESATFAGFLIRFRPKQETLLPEYSRFYFRNLLLRAFFVKEMNLVTRASLSQELLKKLPVTLPSLHEQKQIADFLSQKDQIFEKLIQNSIVQISLLKERRTALISSAVTGKIDVRNWQKPNKNNNAKTEFGA